MVKFVLVNTSDVSTNKTRWNEFAVVVNTYFLNEAEGWWDYDVYEQASTTNTDLSLTGGKLESGLMFLDDNSEPVDSLYDNDINFTFYNGS